MRNAAGRPRVAIAHDYLTQRGGAERVVLSMLKAFPEAPVYTTLFNPDTTFPEFRGVRVHTTALNRIRTFREDHRKALPFLAAAVTRAPIDADVVLASTSGWAHGFPTAGHKVAYCHSPARFLYLPQEYLGSSRPTPAMAALSLLGPPLRAWDARAAASVETYLCNSTVIADRIRRVYDRDATVIPPPAGVDPEGATIAPSDLGDWTGFFLVVSRLLPYKNVDRVIAAFHEHPHRLVVIGDGPQRAELERDLPPNVRLLSGISDAELRWCYRNSAALIAASYEDYGLTPLEAGRFGRPVVALRAGGYLDTVAEGVNGYFFEQSEPEEIRQAVDRLAARPLSPAGIAAHLEAFSEPSFIARLQSVVAQVST